MYHKSSKRQCPLCHDLMKKKTRFIWQCESIKHMGVTVTYVKVWKREKTFTRGVR